jgi:hypothetical protein
VFLEKNKMSFDSIPGTAAKMTTEEHLKMLGNCIAQLVEKIDALEQRIRVLEDQLR